MAIIIVIFPVSTIVVSSYFVCLYDLVTPSLYCNPNPNQLGVSKLFFKIILCPGEKRLRTPAENHDFKWNDIKFKRSCAIC